MNKYTPTPTGSVRIDTYRVQKSNDIFENIIGFLVIFGLIVLIYGCNAS